MAPHPHTVFVNRPRPRARRPRLLAGSVALAVALQASLALLGHWQAGTSHAGQALRPASVAASEVLAVGAPVPDKPPSTF